MHLQSQNTLYSSNDYLTCSYKGHHKPILFCYIHTYNIKFTPKKLIIARGTEYAWRCTLRMQNWALNKRFLYHILRTELKKEPLIV